MRTQEFSKIRSQNMLLLVTKCFVGVEVLEKIFRGNYLKNYFLSKPQ